MTLRSRQAEQPDEQVELRARGAGGAGARRYRVRFSKLGKIRFTSHRDVARMWERALRRVGLPVAYTEGFSPRPKVSFGLALSTGHESLAEYLDVELDGAAGEAASIDTATLPGRLTAALPEGIDVTGAVELGTGVTSLQEAVSSCTWRIEVAGLDVPGAQRLVDDALAAESLVITRQRKGRDVTDDVRPAVLALAVAGHAADGSVELETELGVHPRSVRPAELLVALGGDLEERRVLRTAQWIWRDGAREEPLPLAAAIPDATRRPHPGAPSAPREDHPDVRPRGHDPGTRPDADPPQLDAEPLAVGGSLRPAG